jgi:hypothetical protein
MAITASVSAKGSHRPITPMINAGTANTAAGTATRVECLADRQTPRVGGRKEKADETDGSRDLEPSEGRYRPARDTGPEISLPLH